jgi:RNA polymerase sigma factor (sigma-70 family)
MSDSGRTSGRSWRRISLYITTRKFMVSTAPEFPFEVLVSRAQAGDPEAFNELFARYLPALYACARLRMGPALRAKESISDIVQSACREILKDLRNLQPRGEGSFQSWLFVVVMRKIRAHERYFRAGRRNPGREVRQPVPDDSEADAAVASLSGSILTPSKKLMQREEVSRLEDLLATLDESERTAILLRDICRLPWKDIVRSLLDAEPDLTEGALKKRYARAKARLWELWRSTAISAE